MCVNVLVVCLLETDSDTRLQSGMKCSVMGPHSGCLGPSELGSALLEQDFPSAHKRLHYALGL